MQGNRKCAVHIKIVDFYQICSEKSSQQHHQRPVVDLLSMYMQNIIRQSLHKLSIGPFEIVLITHLLKYISP